MVTNHRTPNHRVTEPLSHRTTVLPGPAGIAPASRRRPPAHSGRLRALGVVRQRRALCCAAELRYPVARGLAHARQKKLEQPGRLLRLFLVSGCIARHPLGAAEAAICVIDDTASPKAHVGWPSSAPPARGECGTARAPEDDPIHKDQQLSDSVVTRDNQPHRSPPTHQLTISPSPQVERRRRDEAAGALSSGSRVDPLPIAPCRAGRRRSTVLLYCCSSQTVGCQTALPSET